jgi:glutamate synthase domain-containing protein 2
VDGAEGGTGAAPPEFSNSVGMPLVEGLTFVDNVLIGAGVRNEVKVPT